MLKISGATQKPRVTGHAELVKKNLDPKISSPSGKAYPLLANMAATEAIVDLIGRKVLKR